MDHSPLSAAAFKAYDVRGTVPDQINEPLAHAVGRAFVAVTGAASVVVGHDMRPSSPGLAAAFAEGATRAGADVVMTTSALLRHGPSHLGRLRAGLAEWLSTNEYRSVAQLRGSMSHQRVPDASAFERANYVGSLASFEAPRFSR